MGEDPKELFLSVVEQFFKGIEFFAFDEKAKARKKRAALRKKRLAAAKKKKKHKKGNK